MMWKFPDHPPWFRWTGVFSTNGEGIIWPGIQSWRWKGPLRITEGRVRQDQHRSTRIWGIEPSIDLINWINGITVSRFLKALLSRINKYGIMDPTSHLWTTACLQPRLPSDVKVVPVWLGRLRIFARPMDRLCWLISVADQGCPKEETSSITSYYIHLPFGKQTVGYWKWPSQNSWFPMDLPIKNDDFPYF